MIDINAQRQYNAIPLQERLKDPKFQALHDWKAGKGLIRHRSSRGNRPLFREGWGRIFGKQN